MCRRILRSMEFFRRYALKFNTRRLFGNGIESSFQACLVYNKCYCIIIMYTDLNTDWNQISEYDVFQ
jgi:hypothetical protein